MYGPAPAMHAHRLSSFGAGVNKGIVSNERLDLILSEHRNEARPCSRRQTQRLSLPSTSHLTVYARSADLSSKRPGSPHFGSLGGSPGDLSRERRSRQLTARIHESRPLDRNVADPLTWFAYASAFIATLLHRRCNRSTPAARIASRRRLGRLPFDVRTETRRLPFTPTPQDPSRAVF